MAGPVKGPWLWQSSRQFLECPYSQMVVFLAAWGICLQSRLGLLGAQHSILLQETRFRELDFRDQGTKSRKFRIVMFYTVLEHSIGPQYIIVDLMNEQDMWKGIEEKLHIWQLCLTLMKTVWYHTINFNSDWSIVMPMNEKSGSFLILVFYNNYCFFWAWKRIVSFQIEIAY